VAMKPEGGGQEAGTFGWMGSTIGTLPFSLPKGDGGGGDLGRLALAVNDRQQLGVIGGC
jgi:hypothetical protein